MEKGEKQKVVSRYSRKTILEAVHLVESGVLRREIITRFGCAEVTLGEWMKTYGSQTYHQNKRRVYSKTEKRSIVNAVRNGMSLQEVQIAYGLKSTKLIGSWVRQFESEKFDLCVSEEVMAKKKKEQEPDDVAALRRELELAKLKIEALNTLIDVAEDHLKIDIRKKSGAGRSSK
ncbi:hypothetical protein [Fluviicola taffensis]|uniref:hypothetical protein n=1 Tax=Fluviicola taffensis TaxID=191579 RepID=UPI0031378D53